MKNTLFSLLVLVLLCIHSSLSVANPACVMSIERLVLPLKGIEVQTRDVKEVISKTQFGSYHLSLQNGVKDGSSALFLTFSSKPYAHVENLTALRNLEGIVKEIFPEAKTHEAQNEVVVLLPKAGVSKSKLAEVTRILRKQKEEFSEISDFLNNKELRKGLDFFHEKHFKTWADFRFNKNFYEYLETVFKKLSTLRLMRNNPKTSNNRLVVSLLLVPELFAEMYLSPQKSFTQHPNYKTLRQLDFSHEEILQLQEKLRAYIISSLREYPLWKNGSSEKHPDEIFTAPHIFYKLFPFQLKRIETTEDASVEGKETSPTYYHKSGKLAYGESAGASGERIPELAAHIKLPRERPSIDGLAGPRFSYSRVEKVSELQLSESTLGKIRQYGIRRVEELLGLNVREVHEKLGFNRAEIIELCMELLINGLSLRWDANWDRSTFRIRAEYPEFYDHKAQYHLPAKHYPPEVVE